VDVRLSDYRECPANKQLEDKMKLLNFGSLNIDYVYSVDHFVRPGETISSSKMEQFCGGKGLNQSIAVARAGGPIRHAGKIGRDGVMLTDLLASSGVDVGLIAQSEAGTGHAVIQVDVSGQNCILLYSGANHDIDTAFIDSVLAGYGKGDLILLQNEIVNLPYLMQKSYERGIKIALNPSPIDQALLSYPLEYVTWLILNEIEGNALTGKTDPEEIADALLKKYPESAVLLTLGRKGVLYKDKAVCERHGTYRVKPVDTTAAGDTFTGFFIAGIYEGLPMKDILRRASVASSIAVSRKGASPSIPTMKEVLNANLALEYYSGM
jgi:ribokinase